MWVIVLCANFLFAPGSIAVYSCYDCVYSDLSQDVGVTNDCSDPFQSSQASTCTGNLCVIAWLDFDSYGFVVNRTCASDGPPSTDPNQCLMLNSFGLPYTFFVYADMCCAESSQAFPYNGSSIPFTAYACFCTVDRCNGAVQNFVTRTHPTTTTTRTKAMITTTAARHQTTTATTGRIPSTGTGTPGSRQTAKVTTTAAAAAAAAGTSTAKPATTVRPLATTAKIGSTAAAGKITTLTKQQRPVAQTVSSKQPLDSTITTMMPTTIKQPNNNNNAGVVVPQMSLLLHVAVAVAVVIVASMNIVF